MKKILALLFVAISLCIHAFAQNSVSFIIKDHDSKEALLGVTISCQELGLATASDSEGKLRFNDLKNGRFYFTFSFIGYEKFSDSITIPVNGERTIYLQSLSEELEEIIVTSTRSSRSIDDVASRVEAISAEEIGEKSNMRPTNVSMILHESTGIQVQQTSASSANQSIRIQGLDGRYTQLLKDGIPAFGGFASGLSILEIPPLDLKQVEVIKGPASTLYGGGAIAGVVNFISKSPEKTPETLLLANYASTRAFDLAAFASRKYKYLGFTFLASANQQEPYDVNKDDFTELPLSKALTITPKLFFYLNEKTELSIGHSFTTQKRLGGDVQRIKSGESAEHSYFEENFTERNSTVFNFKYNFTEASQLSIKQQYGSFKRTIALPNYLFEGRQINAYTDISYSYRGAKNQSVVGLNILSENFKEQIHSALDRSQKILIPGIYIQDNWDISEKLVWENGLRYDWIEENSFILPRTSLLYRVTQKLSSRIGGGLGYKYPTIFTEKTEERAYADVLPLNPGLKAERSAGLTWDFNYKTAISDKVVLTLNQLFFYTKIKNALVLNNPARQFTFYENTAEDFHSRGFETNLRVSYGDLKLFAGYTYTDARSDYFGSNSEVPLIAKNRLNFACIFERHQDLKIGLEGYYSDRQRLSTRGYSPSFWEFGFMVEKTIGKVSLFINFENFTDTRQSRFGKVVDATVHSSPIFQEIYTHTEGRVINGGFKIRL